MSGRWIASGRPSWVIVCMQSAKAARTAEKVWFRSGGTSVSSLPFSGWGASPRETRVWAIASCAWATEAAATRNCCSRRSYSSRLMAAVGNNSWARLKSARARSRMAS